MRVHRETHNAILPAVRFSGDPRPFIYFGEADGTGYFARMFSQGVETFNLSSSGVVGAGIWEGNPIGTIYGGTGLSASGSSGHYLRSDGSSWTSSAIQASDVPVPWTLPAPATHASPGTAGQISYDSTNFYVCVATNSWLKFAGSPSF